MMKKIIIFLFAILSFNLCVAFADIETSENPTNIGIGTNSTENALSIRGTMALGSSTYTSRTAPANGLIVEGNVGIGTFETTYKLDVDGPARLGGNGNLAFTNSIILNAAVSNILAITGGNVGINSTNPGKTLDVLGTGRFSSSLSASSLTATGLTSGQCVQTTTGGLLTTTGSACGSGGSITIGTTSPMTGAGTGFSFTLGVDETKLTLSNIGGSVTDAQVPNNITVDNATNASNLGADGVNALTEIDQSIKTALNDTSKLVVGTAGSTNDCAKWDANGNLVTAGAACGSGSGGINNVVEDTTPQLGGSLDVNGQIITSASNGNVIITPNGTGRVGIGTVGPTQALQVVGTIAATAFTGDGSGLTAIGASALATDSVSADELNATGVEAELEAVMDLQDMQGAVTDGQVPDSVTVTSWALGASTATTPAEDDNDTSVATTAYVQTEISSLGSGAWVDGGTNVYVSPTTDNVGIGTTTPTAALLVENAGTRDSFRVNDSAVDASPFVITSTGNVGIGTSNPTSHFQYGSVAASNFITMVTSSAPAMAIRADAATSADLLNIQGLALVTNNALDVSSSSASQTVPLVSMVQSGASSGGSLRVNQSSATSTGRAVHVTNAGTFDSFLVEDVATDSTPFVINSVGNVGIGTTNPSTNIHVVGGARITGLDCSGNANGGAVTADSSGVLSCTDDDSGGAAGGWSDGGTNVFTSTTTDLVGIGTTTPSTTLEIVKQGSSAPLMVSATATGDGDVLIVTSGGRVGIGTLLPRGPLDLGPTGTLYTQTITGPTGPTILGTSNNVGIGTITAGSLLTVGSTGQAAITSAGVATLPTPNLTGKIDINNVAVDDDDCTGEQGKFWYDSTDSAFEFCRDNSGTPERLGHPSPPASQTITAGATITADACGTFKDISSAGAVTTDTTNTFTAPSSDLSGCCMNVVNTGANNITLDNNSLFYSAGGADVVLGLADSAIVCTNGTVWAQMGGSNN